MIGELTMGGLGVGTWVMLTLPACAILLSAVAWIRASR